MFVEIQCCFEIYSVKCFLEVINGVSGNNRTRKFVPVTYDHYCGEGAVAQWIYIIVGLKFGSF